MSDPLEAFWAKYPGYNFCTFDQHGMIAVHTTEPLYHGKSGRWVPQNGGQRLDVSLTDTSGKSAEQSLLRRPIEYNSTPAKPDPKTAPTEALVRKDDSLQEIALSLLAERVRTIESNVNRLVEALMPKPKVKKAKLKAKAKKR